MAYAFNFILCSVPSYLPGIQLQCLQMQQPPCDHRKNLRAKGSGDGRERKPGSLRNPYTTTLALAC